MQVITEAEASIQKEKERGKKREEKETISADGGVTHATGSTSGVPGHSAIDSTSPGTSQPNEQRYALGHLHDIWMPISFILGSAGLLILLIVL